MLASGNDDPHERRAPPLAGGAPFRITGIDTRDPHLAALVCNWPEQARRLLRQPGLSIETRLRLGDGLRIVEELAGILGGTEAGVGRRSERQLWLAVAGGRVQALCSLFECRAACFIELIATAPWNLLGPECPRDLRAVRGAGSALLGWAERRSRERGGEGRLALQAENPRARRFYERLGFAPMRPADGPFTLVPSGEEGWSTSLARVARGEPGPEEERTPWMVRPPPARHCAAGVGHPLAGVAG